ncbi:MAG: hypothetical protein L0Z48_02165 [candidate division Zixibacteria bacterium]|nr:hypothetical protein [candidate division Zixibacteria bacterium]MCI0595328.1 hypothetical protein [candidate division Zixibacteria bacterium]
MFAEKLRLVADRIAEIFAEFFAFLPTLLVAAAVFLAGWVLARFFRYLVIRFPFKRAGGPEPRGFLPGHKLSPRELAGHFVFWFFLLLTTVLSFEVIGLPVGAGIMERLLGTVPRIFVSLLIFVFGFLLAFLVEAALRELLQRMALDRPAFWSRAFRWATLIVVALLAMEQLGLAAQFALWLVLIPVGAAALAFALAFGLGCRQIARDLVIEFFRKEESSGPAK